jgi:hypothetical protein
MDRNIRSRFSISLSPMFRTGVTFHRILNQREMGEIPGNNGVFADGAAPGAARSAENDDLPPDLAIVVQQWPKLPEQIKAGILAMVRAGS